MSNRNPEERSASIPPATPDQPTAHATGAEVTTEPARMDVPRPQLMPEEEADALARAQALASEYYGKLSDLTLAFGEQVGDYYGRSRETVGSNPLPSLSGAFVVGIVLGAILGRR
jgi:ElaB/YqjD/DUF883 family membrane-anchored ribosome-binding protein